MTVKLLVMASNPTIAREFAQNQLGITRGYGETILIVHDPKSLEDALNLPETTPWLVVPDPRIPQAAAQQMFMRFGPIASQLPLEFAPKDGRTVMLHGPSGYREPYNEHRETGHWHQFDGRKGVDGCWVSDDGEPYTAGWPEPTGWWPK